MNRGFIAVEVPQNLLQKKEVMEPKDFERFDGFFAAVKNLIVMAEDNGAILNQHNIILTPALADEKTVGTTPTQNAVRGVQVHGRTLRIMYFWNKDPAPVAKLISDFTRE